MKKNTDEISDQMCEALKFALRLADSKIPFDREDLEGVIKETTERLRFRMDHSFLQSFFDVDIFDISKLKHLVLRVSNKVLIRAMFFLPSVLIFTLFIEDLTQSQIIVGCMFFISLFFYMKIITRSNQLVALRRMIATLQHREKNERETGKRWESDEEFLNSIEKRLSKLYENFKIQCEKDFHDLYSNLSSSKKIQRLNELHARNNHPDFEKMLINLRNHIKK